jgi:hypothetical protein
MEQTCLGLRRSVLEWVVESRRQHDGQGVHSRRKGETDLLVNTTTGWSTGIFRIHVGTSNGVRSRKPKKIR